MTPPGNSLWSNRKSTLDVSQRFYGSSQGNLKQYFSDFVDKRLFGTSLKLKMKIESRNDISFSSIVLD